MLPNVLRRRAGCAEPQTNGRTPSIGFRGATQLSGKSTGMLAQLRDAQVGLSASACSVGREFLSRRPATGSAVGDLILRLELRSPDSTIRVIRREAPGLPPGAGSLLLCESRRA